MITFQKKKANKLPHPISNQHEILSILYIYSILDRFFRSVLLWTVTRYLLIYVFR